jgi:hypothetical protein
MKKSYEIQLIPAEKLRMPFLSIASPKREYQIGIFQTLDAIRNLKMDNIREKVKPDLINVIKFRNSVVYIKFLSKKKKRKARPAE